MNIPFGKYKGRPTDEVPTSYLNWCLKQDFVENNWPPFYEHLLTLEESLIQEVSPHE